MKATYTRNNREETKTIVPDAYLEFACTGQNGKDETIPVMLELDRGTEGQKFFRRRIRAYIVFLKSRAFKSLFNIENITIAFATTRNHNRVKQMREWTQKELAVTNEPEWLYDLLLFTALPENMDALEPSQLFLGPVWYVPSDDENPVSLLGEQ
jgi:hypothetical protein